MPHQSRDQFYNMIGISPPMQTLYGLLDKIVSSDSTVLITGENGTGKELVAKAIHYGSLRKKKPFIVQNCSAFNENLLDSELFGHKQGAFTGAQSDKKGLFAVADQGTFFLDEIGDMSPAMQVKILRVLQEGTFTPVGDTQTRRVDVRIIAATNRNLEAMVSSGQFREDLYYRINVIALKIPALRDRCEDIDILSRHFLDKHGGKNKELSPDCLAQLRGFHWPGNIRELENEMERLVVLAGEETLLKAELLSARISRSIIDHVDSANSHHSLPAALRELEKRMIRQALLDHQGNKTRAAKQLEISRRNLIRLVQKYELDKQL